MTVKIAHIATVDLSLRYLLLNQLQSLQQAGYQVTGISAPGPDVPIVEEAGIPHIPVNLTRNVTPVADMLALWQLYRILRREKFTIVHGHTPKAELLGQVAARLAGVPIVVDTFRGIYFRKGMHPLWRRLFLLMSKIAAGCADVVLSQSREARDMALEAGICRPEKIKLLGNGIDVGHFKRSRLNPDEQAKLRQQLGLAADAPVVGFVGRLVREKGLVELLQAARHIREQMPTVRFLLIGPTDYDKPDAITPAMAREYGLQEACIFAGKQHPEVMPAYYGLMDVFVLPSHRESFPRSPMEASAMAVPCVVTDIPGCREVVAEGQNGRLVPPGEAEALAGAILSILQDSARAGQMGRAGRSLALEKFDEQKVFDTIKAEYARLLEEQGLLKSPPQTVTPAG